MLLLPWFFFLSLFLSSSYYVLFNQVTDAAYLAEVPNVVRWFTTCVNQPQFCSILGNVDICSEEQKAGNAANAKPSKPETKKTKVG